MKRLRLFLVVAIALAIVIQVPSPSIAQSVPRYVTSPKTTGSPGTFTVQSTGAFCEVETGTSLLKARATGPVPQLTGGMTSGRVDWTPAVSRVLFDTRGTPVVVQGATQSLTISTNNTKAFQNSSFEHLPGGDFYALGGTLTWYNANSTVRGTYTFIFQRYDNARGSAHSSTQNFCNRAAEPTLALSTTRTTVDTVIALQGSNYPASQPVSIIWKNNVVGSVMSDALGNVSGSFKTTATPMGAYSLGFDGGQQWKVAISVTVVPRVKVIPSSAGRGQTVKVSLRGFAKGETVRVRWIKGNSWVELGRVKMSSTGSGEFWVPVPSWVPNGSSSVRGDGTSGRAQTNAVAINGGLAFTSASEQTPTPSPTATTTATATATTTATIPASPEISPTGSPTATEPVGTETPTPAETTTETATSTQTAEPTVEVSPTITETVEPTTTLVPTEAPAEPTSS